MAVSDRASGWRWMCCVLICAAIVCGGPAVGRAQTRRALIVGINKYVTDPGRDRAKDLDGAVNDAHGISETLSSLHHFPRANIRVLLDQQATRARILQELQTHLIDGAAAGDISVFFFAGHGSYRDSAASPEVDRQDETIVPADSNAGAADIADKELAEIFHRALDHGIRWVALFDSCHSGSIARGLAAEAKIRFAPPLPASGSLRSPNRGHEPVRDRHEDPPARGAVILAAAQDQQTAQERLVRGKPRGRFSSALEQVLTSGAVGEPLGQMFARLRALMQAGGSLQEPALASSAERLLQPLWGGADSTASRAPAVTVLRVSASVVYLDAGYVMGLGSQALLQGSLDPTLRLQVTEVLGPGSSKAISPDGRLSQIKAGDVFSVNDFGAPYVRALRVYLPDDAPTRQDISRFLSQLAPLRQRSPGMFVMDPTQSTPTHQIVWRSGQWLLRGSEGDIALGADPARLSLRAIRTVLAQPGHRLFVTIPPSRELTSALSFPHDEATHRVVHDGDPGHSDYHLIGRWTERAADVEYAWVLPNSDPKSARILPIRTRWISAADVAARDDLWEHAQRLGRILLWQTLIAPPSLHPFPYQLRLRSTTTGEDLRPDGVVREGDAYVPTLVADTASLTGLTVQPRYVYLFSIDQTGRSTLLVPGNGVLVGENQFPNRRLGTAAPVAMAIGLPITVSPPLGLDTLLLLTTATALPRPSFLQMDAVSDAATRGAQSCSHPLECLLRGIQQDVRGPSSAAAPADWSIDRLLVRSVPRVP